MLNSVKKKYLKVSLAVVGIAILIFSALLVSKFLLNKDVMLKQEEDTGDINVLVLGIAGGVHDGADLTDTIIVASINQEENSVNLVSIPRDLWVPELEAKINSAYSFGELKDERGKLLAKSIVGNVTGKQIDYVFVIDFSGFVKLIDHLGGIEVIVENTLDDYKYPITGKENDLCGKAEEELSDLTSQIASGSASEEELFPCRYEHIHFDKGVQEMTGEEALKFVRSRHGVNGEGNDFARSQRQQAVISALRNKAFSLGILLNPVKVLGAINIIQDNIDMNAELTELDDFVNLADKMKDAKITSLVIDEGDEEEQRNGLLINPPISEEYNYQWVLIPRVGSGNYSEIIEYIECRENELPCKINKSGLGNVGEN